MFRILRLDVKLTQSVTVRLNRVVEWSHQVCGVTTLTARPDPTKQFCWIVSFGVTTPVFLLFVFENRPECFHTDVSLRPKQVQPRYSALSPTKLKLMSCVTFHWIPSGRVTVVSIVYCRCTYCCPATNSWENNSTLFMILYCGTLLCAQVWTVLHVSWAWC